MPDEGIPKGPMPHGKWMALGASSTHCNSVSLRPRNSDAASRAVATAPVRAVGRKAETRST